MIDNSSTPRDSQNSVSKELANNLQSLLSELRSSMWVMENLPDSCGYGLAIDSVEAHRIASALHEAVKAIEAQQADGEAEPIATVCFPDPDDERDGVRFSLKDWAKLNALPAGTRLFARPAASSTEQPLSASEGREAGEEGFYLRFEAGFRVAATWAHREDLYADVGSPAYEKDRAEALAGVAIYLDPRLNDLPASQQGGVPVDALKWAAQAVCAFDWSDNDDDAVAAIERLRRALRNFVSSTAGADGWQPIETAPTQGAILLVVEADCSTHPERRVFCAEQSFSEGAGWHWLVTTGWIGWLPLHSGWRPIGWKHLPVPPLPGAAQEGKPS